MGVHIPTRYGSVRAYEWSAPDHDDQRPVVLLPGRTSGAPMWREKLPALIASRRVIALDALGDAGLSSQGVPLETMADQVAWFDDVLEAVSPGEGCTWSGTPSAAPPQRPTSAPALGGWAR